MREGLGFPGSTDNRGAADNKEAADSIEAAGSIQSLRHIFPLSSFCAFSFDDVAPLLHSPLHLSQQERSWNDDDAL